MTGQRRYTGVDRPTRLKIAAEAGRDYKTVEAVLRGDGSPQSRAAVAGAVRRLGLPISLPQPSTPTPPSSEDAAQDPKSPR
jgi:sugar phosphate isomerase/epimerase